MKNYMASSLRRWLKKRKRITEALIVIFLMTGSIGYGRVLINSENVPEDGIVNISSEDTTYSNGIDIEADNVTINNNGSINGTFGDGTNTIRGLGNGIFGGYLLTNVKINNNGMIIGNTGEDLDEDHNSGNGVYGDVGENNGMIIGNIGGDLNSLSPISYYRSGNGVFGDVGENNGAIIGNIDVVVVGNYSYGSSYSGNGVYGDVGENNGMIIGDIDVVVGKTMYIYPYDSGNGVYGDVGKNNGVIIGDLNARENPGLSLDGSVNGVYGDVGENNGVISANLDVILKNGDSLDLTSTNSVNGVYGNVEENNGVISVNFDATKRMGSSSSSFNVIFSSIRLASNGIFVYDSSAGVKINNNGVISVNFNENSRGSQHITPHLENSVNGVSGDVGKNNGAISINLGETIYSSSSDYSPYLNLINSGNGVNGDVGENNGIISVNLDKILETRATITESIAENSANGINGIIADNKGTLVGNVRVKLIRSGEHGRISSVFSGNGMAYDGELKDNIINSGFTAGSGSAIALSEEYSHEGTIRNYGILSGRKIISSGEEILNIDRYIPDVTLKDLESKEIYKNYGLDIVLKDNGNMETDGSIISIERGLGGKVNVNGETFTILNTDLRAGDTDSYNEITTNTAYSDHIINGAGVESGALTIDNAEMTLNNSIINGYEKAITLKNGGSLTATDTIFNGGGVGRWNDNGTSYDYLDDYLEHTNVIEGDEGINIVSLRGKSIVNGSIDLGSGDDSIDILGDSIINGDVNLGSGSDRIEILDNATINGSIDLGEGDDIIKISSASQINGNIDLGEGNDTMTVSSVTQINGDLEGGVGEDTLTLGDTPYIQSELDEGTGTTVDYEKSLKIYHSINDFEYVNIAGSVTLYETAKVSDTKRIFISNDSTLNLRIDPTVVIDGKVAGHALYDSGAIILGETSRFDGIENYTTAGTLNLVTSGLGTGSIITMGNSELDDKLYVRTDSLIHRAEKIGDGDIKIDVGKDLSEIFDYGAIYPEMEPIAPRPDPETPDLETPNPETPSIVEPSQPEKPKVPEWVEKNNYDKLDKIYQSNIVSGDDNVNALYPTINLNDKSEDKAGENLLYLLNDIFMANPYGYASRSSHETFGLFNESILSDKFKPNEGNWLIYGRLNVGGSDYDNDYNNHFRANYYGFDTEKVVINSESRNYGGYGKAEYGLTDKTSAGIMVGGANSKTDISNGSKLDGDSLYLGGYGKTEINNFRLVGGVGYQYGNFNTTRIAKNDYQSFKHEGDMKTDSFGVYGGITYEYLIDEKWSVEPNARLSYTNVRQSSVDEGDTILGINTDSTSKNYLDTEVGVDLVRTVRYNDRLAKIRAGVSYAYSLDGADASYVTGRFQGGSDFDILVPEESKGKTKIKASYDVEYDSGVVFDIGGGYTFGKDASDYYVGVGVGYKFNNLKDFMPQKNTVIEEPVEIVEKKEEVRVELEALELEENSKEVTAKILRGFPLNSTKLSEGMKIELEELAEKLKGTTKDIKIIGYTDNTGSAEINKKMSLERAKSAKEFMEEILEDVKIEAKGMGSENPIESNATPEGRRKNRRISVEY